MIVGVAFCPHPPALVPELSPGTDPELAQVRAASAAAVRFVLDMEPRRLVLIGSGPQSLAHGPLARGSLAGYGLDASIALGSPGCGGDENLPLSQTIGAFLLAGVAGPRSGAIGFSVGPGFATTRPAAQLLGIALSEQVGLVVLGDGSARRTERAPGYLDDRAVDYDRGVVTALRTGDGEALANLDEPLGLELLAAGTPAWRAAGALLAGGTYEADVLYEGDPFGVGYYVAQWRARD